MSDKFSAGSGPVLSFKPKLLFNFPFIFPLQDSRLTYLNLPTKRPAFSGNKKKRHFEFCSPLIKNFLISFCQFLIKFALKHITFYFFGCAVVWLLIRETRAWIWQQCCDYEWTGKLLCPPSFICWYTHTPIHIGHHICLRAVKQWYYFTILGICAHDNSYFNLICRQLLLFMTSCYSLPFRYLL